MLLYQGSHFLENQGMLGILFWLELPQNFAACQEIFYGQMPIFGLLIGIFTDVRNVNNGISGELVFTASVVLDAMGSTGNSRKTGWQMPTDVWYCACNFLPCAKYCCQSSSVGWKKNDKSCSDIGWGQVLLRQKF